MKWFMNRDYVENFVRFHKKAILKGVAGFILFAFAFFTFCIRDNEVGQDEFQLINGVEGQAQTEELALNEDKEGAQTGSSEGSKESTGKIFVDISGAVNHPYVYEMEDGARLFEALELAGGLQKDADTAGLNLAQILKDQDKIVVLTKEQTKQMASANSTGGTQQVGAGTINGGTGQGNAGSPININTATSEELQTINGIGPSTAEKILTYRNENGLFSRIEDIMNVSGIGEKTFAKFKSKITV